MPVTPIIAATSVSDALAKKVVYFTKAELIQYIESIIAMIVMMRYRAIDNYTLLQ